MNKAKKALAVVLAVAMMVPTTAFAATPSTAKVNIDGKSDTVAYTYTGKDQKIKITIGGVTLTEGTDFKLDTKEPLDVGTYKLSITGIGECYGNATINYSIVKAQKPVATLKKKSQKAVTKGLKVKKLKKSSKKIKLKFKTDSKTVKYHIKEGKSRKYLTVNSKGKVTCC